MAVGIVLLVFNLYDQYIFVREDVETPGALAEDVQPRRRLHIQGKRNLIFLAGVIAAAISSGYFAWPRGIQELLMISMASMSWFSTPKSIHDENHFNFHPILEVAAVFAGIFITMVPALEILRMRSLGLVGAKTESLNALLHSDLGVSLLRAVSAGSVFMGANSYIGNGPNFMVKSIAEHHRITMPSFGRYMLYSATLLIPTFLLINLVFFR